MYKVPNTTDFHTVRTQSDFFNLITENKLWENKVKRPEEIQNKTHVTLFCKKKNQNFFCENFAATVSTSRHNGMFSRYV